MATKARLLASAFETLEGGNIRVKAEFGDSSSGAGLLEITSDTATLADSNEGVIDTFNG